jgi:GPH family glycoside/pentoside/hexuronide:cation symporter
MSLMVVRLWDVFSDQLVVWLADRTHHRLALRVSWMRWGALPLRVSMALMTWVPPFTGWARV